MSEKNWIAQIKKGDELALQKLIETYYPNIYRFIYGKLSVKEDVKDLTQEVFFKFIKQLPFYQHKGSVEAYLYKMATNICNDYYRKRQKMVIVEFDEEWLNELRDTKSNEEKDITWILEKVPKKEQELLKLHHIEGRTFKEIASLWKEQEATIKSRYYRTLKKIRENYDIRRIKDE